MEELKSCPFCGGKASKSKGKYGNGTDWFYIECNECGASAEVEIWNTRAKE